jgi:hypothetical protein
MSISVNPFFKLPNHSFAVFTTNLPWLVPSNHQLNKKSKSAKTKKEKMTTNADPQFVAYILSFISFVYQKTSNLDVLISKTYSCQKLQHLLHCFQQENHCTELHPNMKLNFPELVLHPRTISQITFTYSILPSWQSVSEEIVQSSSSTSNSKTTAISSENINVVKNFFDGTTKKVLFSISPTNKITSILDQVLVFMNTSADSVFQHLYESCREFGDTSDTGPNHLPFLGLGRLFTWLKLRVPTLKEQDLFSVFSISELKCLVKINYGMLYLLTCFSLQSLKDTIHYPTILLLNLYQTLDKDLFDCEQPDVKAFVRFLQDYKTIVVTHLMCELLDWSNYLNIKNNPNYPGKAVEWISKAHPLLSSTINMKKMNKSTNFLFVLDSLKNFEKNDLSCSGFDHLLGKISNDANMYSYYTRLPQIMQSYRFNLASQKRTNPQWDRVDTYIELGKSILFPHSCLLSKLFCFLNPARKQVIREVTLGKVIKVLQEQLHSLRGDQWCYKYRYIRAFLTLSILYDVREFFYASAPLSETDESKTNNLNRWVHLTIPFKNILEIDRLKSTSVKKDDFSSTTCDRNLAIASKIIYEVYQKFCINHSNILSLEKREKDKVLFTLNSEVKKIREGWVTLPFIDKTEDILPGEIDLNPFKEDTVETEVDFAITKTDLSKYPVLFDADANMLNSFLTSSTFSALTIQKSNSFLLHLLENQVNNLYKCLAVISYCYSPSNMDDNNMSSVFSKQVLASFANMDVLDHPTGSFVSSTPDLMLESSSSSMEDYEFTTTTESEENEYDESSSQMDEELIMSNTVSMRPLVDMITSISSISEGNSLIKYHKEKKREPLKKRKRKPYRTNSNPNKRPRTLYTNGIKNNIPILISREPPTTGKDVSKSRTFKRTKLNISFYKLLETYINDQDFHIFWHLGKKTRVSSSNANDRINRAGFVDFDCELVSSLYEMMEFLPQEIQEEVLHNISFTDDVNNDHRNVSTSKGKKGKEMEQDEKEEEESCKTYLELQAQLYKSNSKYQNLQIMAKSFHYYLSKDTNLNDRICSRFCNTIQKMNPTDNSSIAHHEKMIQDPSSLTGLDALHSLLSIIHIGKDSTRILNKSLPNLYHPKNQTENEQVKYAKISAIIDTFSMERLPMSSMTDFLTGRRQYAFAVDEQEISNTLNHLFTAANEDDLIELEQHTSQTPMSAKTTKTTKNLQPQQHNINKLPPITLLDYNTLTFSGIRPLKTTNVDTKYVSKNMRGIEITEEITTSNGVEIKHHYLASWFNQFITVDLYQAWKSHNNYNFQQQQQQTQNTTHISELKM